MFCRFGIICGLMVAQTPAVAAVTGPSSVVAAEAPVEHALTPVDALRAQTDVQIRRIKSMIVNRQVNQDEAYEQLQRLQKNLRGES